MRTPDASAVVVALSTLVAITTVSVVMSQLAPADRAGATLPLSPITTTAEPLDLLETLDIDPEQSGPTPGSSSDSSATNDSAVNPGSAVVGPAPAEPVIEPEPEPTTPTTPPGNSANAPGHGGANPGQGAENGKPSG